MPKDDEGRAAGGEVKVTGPLEKVQRLLKDKTLAGAGAVVDEQQSDDNFLRLLADTSAGVFIHMDRISPRRWRDRDDLTGFIDEFVPGTTFEEIQNQTRQKFGGGRYRIRIVKNGKPLAIRGFEVSGEPKMPDDDEDDVGAASGRPPWSGSYAGFGGGPYGYGPGPGFARPFGFGGGVGGSVTDLSRDPEIIQAKKSIELLKIQAEHKRITQQLDPPAPVAQNADDKIEKMLKEQNASWEKRLAEMKEAYERQNQTLREQMERERQQREIASLRSDMQQMIKGLEDKLVQDGGVGGGKQATLLKELRTDFEGKMTKIQEDLNNNLKALRDTKDKERADQIQKAHEDQMREMRRDFEGKFEKLLTNQGGGSNNLKEYADIIKSVFTSSGDRDQKLLGQMFDVFKLQMNQAQKLGPDGEQISEVDRFAQFLDVLGMAKEVVGGGGEKEAVPKDFGTAFLEVVKEAIPQIVDAAKTKEGNVTREEIEQIIKHNLDVVAKRQADKLKQEGRVAVPGSSAAASAAASASARSGAFPGGPAKNGPPGGPNANVPGGAPGLEDTAPGGSSSAAAAGFDEVRERKLRVNALVKAISKELPLRPRTCRWLDFAFDELPEETLDKLATGCASPEDFVEAVKPDADPALITFIQQQLAQVDPGTNQRLKHKWFAETIEILRKEYVKMRQEEAQRDQAIASGAIPASPPPPPGEVEDQHEPDLEEQSPPSASSIMQQPTV